MDSRNGGCAAADGATSNAVISIATNTATERTVRMLDNVVPATIPALGPKDRPDNPAHPLHGGHEQSWQTRRR
ncbi:hypothetical protein MCOO_13990 [Mycobacterium cookii]|uniref:Uncharacterized protein n=1 Tax=Mycobacterium cookii TaxID=1775 RepID=A0A7I7KUC1_9MYCO|nr:hypothetical protein MCOO_13990 [Mycobacterium cookii]